MLFVAAVIALCEKESENDHLLDPIALLGRGLCAGVIEAGGEL
jgi:hypothetical protein